ncbi:MAG: signal transduction histidine kinase [Microbacterium sp.]|nr:signal transduction histidine kinase [Microbacterium sp.]
MSGPGPGSEALETEAPFSLTRMLRTSVFWRARELHPFFRLLLLLVVAVLVCVQIGVMIASGEIARGDLLALGLYSSLALFAWRPLGAALMTMAICGTSAVLTGSGGDLLELGVALVLVAATCVPAVIMLHVCLLGALSVYLVVAESTLVTNGVYGILVCAVVALLAGITVRLFTTRDEFLLAQRARIARAFEEISRLQQDRIADELHDGIAHDLTLLLFHARALPKQPDEESRQVSLTTIEDSASRALRSAQSLLAVMRDAPPRASSRSEEAAPVDVAGAAEALAQKLRDAGIRARVSVSGTADLPPGVAEVLVETITESAMNIIKHAPGATAAVIEVARHADEVTLEVRNNRSRGRAPAESALGGRGMARARERLARFSGELDAGPTSDGWALRAVVPFT